MYNLKVYYDSSDSFDDYKLEDEPPVLFHTEEDAKKAIQHILEHESFFKTYFASCKYKQEDFENKEWFVYPDEEEPWSKKSFYFIKLNSVEIYCTWVGYFEKITFIEIREEILKS